MQLALGPSAPTLLWGVLALGSVLPAFAQLCNINLLATVYQDLLAFVKDLSAWLAASAAKLQRLGSTTGHLALYAQSQDATSLLEVSDSLRHYVCSVHCGEAYCSPQSSEASRLELPPRPRPPTALPLAAPASKALAPALARLRRLGGREPEASDKAGTGALAQAVLDLLHAGLRAAKGSWMLPHRGALAELLEQGGGLQQLAIVETHSLGVLVQPWSASPFAVCHALPLGRPTSRRQGRAYFVRGPSVPAPEGFDWLDDLLAEVAVRSGGLSSSILAIRPPARNENETCQGLVSGLGAGLFTDMSRCFEGRLGWSIAAQELEEGYLTGSSLRSGDGVERSLDLQETPRVEQHIIDEPFVDLLTMSPLAGNCYYLERRWFSKGSQVLPRVAILPINPLVPPPFAVQPNFTSFIRREPSPLMSFFTQCSLMATHQVLNKFHKYRRPIRRLGARKLRSGRAALRLQPRCRGRHNQAGRLGLRGPAPL